MKLIICVDARGGMAFHFRRVSSDRVVTDRILELTRGRLRVAPYSRGLFPTDAPIYAAEDYLKKANPGDWCLIETEDPAPWLRDAEELLLFCWNRTYPADVRFPMALLQHGWEMCNSEDFAGYSHKQITMEVYRKCGSNT